MSNTKDSTPLAWLPAIAKKLTFQQRLELMQLLDFAYGCAFHDESCAYTPLNISDVECAHRAIHPLTIRPKAKKRKSAKGA